MASFSRKARRTGLQHLCVAAVLCMSMLSASAAAASLPIYIVSALPLGGSRNIAQTIVITRDACDYVEIHFTSAGPTKDHFRCRVLSGSEALLGGRGSFVIALDTPQGVEVHQFGLYDQEVSARETPTEVRFPPASLLRVMPSQLPAIRQLSPDPHPPGFVLPAIADLPPPTAAQLLHIQLQGADCTVQYGERSSTLCALTRWGRQARGAHTYEEIDVVVSGAYLQQPEDKVMIALRPETDDVNHWLYTPAHFPPYSPLLLAVQREDLAAVQALLDQGADPNAHPSGIDAPLALAVRRRTLDIANSLVDHRADVSAQDLEFGFVLAMATGYGADADRAGWLDFVKKLLARGADVNRPGPFGVTPLIEATGAQYPDPDMVELLLASGANVNATARIPLGEFLGLMSRPATAYDLAQAKLDTFNKKGVGWGGNPDLGPELQKIMTILAQHGAKLPSPR